MTTSFRVLGLDLAQASDYAAACVLERTTVPEDFVGPVDWRLRCKHLKRYPQGTDYCVVVDHVLVNSKADIIVVDFTGVGRPVVDLLRRRANQRHFPGRIRPVILAGSDARARIKSEERGTHWVVPKIDLVSCALILQQRHGLRLPANADTEQLFQEMREFSMRPTPAGNLQLGTERPGHDDLLIALGLASWWMVRFGIRKPVLQWGGTPEAAEPEPAREPEDEAERWADLPLKDKNRPDLAEALAEIEEEFWGPVR